MLQVQEGQCGLCAHFGEVHADHPTLVQIRTNRVAEDSFVDECDHPNNAKLHLMVTPVSGCDGFTPAKMMN